MALTTRQKINLYSILEVPYSNSVTMPEGKYNMHSTEYLQADSEYKTQVRIEARLVSLGQETENYLVELINKWEQLSTSTVTISGSIGGIQGVDFNPSEQLTRIKSRVLVIVPVFQFLNQIKNEAINMPISQMTIR